MTLPDPMPELPEGTAYDAVSSIEQGAEPEQTDNRPRPEDGEQLAEDVALGAAPLPDA